MTEAKSRGWRLQALGSSILLAACSINATTDSEDGIKEENVKSVQSAIVGSNPGASTPVRWDLDPWLPAEGDSAQRLTMPSLTQPFYNMVTDVHATVSASNTELIFSTNGNWHSALRRVLNEQYFPTHASVLQSNLISTSPPISLPQMQTGRLKVGNIMFVDAKPHVVVAPGAELNTLQAGGYLTGARTNIISTYGNVILKRKCDHKVKTFWDLRKIKPGKFASAEPAEAAAYNNYRSSVLNIALNNPRNPNFTPEKVTEEANELVADLFDEKGVVTIGPPMHRSVAHLVASGEADAALYFLHLAVTAMRENPGVFSAVYIASDKVGETDDPDVLAQGQVPLVGNQASTFQVARTSTPVNAAQSAAREDLIATLTSPAFTQILVESGLKRP